MEKSETERNLANEKKKFFILVSGVHNFEKEKYGTQIFVYTLLPLAHPSH